MIACFFKINTNFLCMNGFSRRNILFSGALAAGGLLTQSFPVLASEVAAPSWIDALEEKLSSFSCKVSRTLNSAGEPELHCTMTNPFDFGSSHGNFSGLGARVTAGGDRLRFQRDGLSVNVILNVANSIPA
jgi:hypothetical protein